MVVVILAERADVPSAAVAALVVVWLLLVLVSLSCSWSEWEDGVDGKDELGATSVSCIPFDAACSAADLLSRYKLNSSPRTKTGTAEDEDEADDAALVLLDGEPATRVEVVVVLLAGVGLKGTSAVHLLALPLLSFLIDAARRACATRRMYGHLLSVDAVLHRHGHEDEQVLLEGVGDVAALLVLPLLRLRRLWGGGATLTHGL